MNTYTHLSSSSELSSPSLKANENFAEGFPDAVLWVAALWSQTSLKGESSVFAPSATLPFNVPSWFRTCASIPLSCVHPTQVTFTENKVKLLPINIFLMAFSNSDYLNELVGENLYEPKYLTFVLFYWIISDSVQYFYGLFAVLLSLKSSPLACYLYIMLFRIS